MSTLPLDQLKPGTKGKVTALTETDPQRLKKLMAMGILPGQHITVIQQYPAHVFALGHTQLAVDTAIARTILVTVEG